MFAAIISLIGTVIWPLTLIALVLYFRKPLRELIGRVTSFKGPAGIEGTFAGELAGASRLVDEATNEVVETSKRLEGEASTSGDDAEPVDVTPSLVVLNAWKRYEESVGRPSVGGTLTGVRDLPASAVTAIKQLKRLRDRVAHGEPVTADIADLYVNSVNQTVLLVASIRSATAERFFGQWQQFFNDVIDEWDDQLGDAPRPFLLAVKQLADEGYIRHLYVALYRELDDKFEALARSGGKDKSRPVRRQDLQSLDQCREVITEAIERKAEDMKNGRPPAPLPIT